MARLNYELDLSLICDSKLLGPAHEISNPMVNKLEAILSYRDHDDLVTAVNLAIAQAAEDAFILGMKFAKDPAAFIVKEEE